VAKAKRRSANVSDEPDGYWHRPVLMDLTADVLFVFAIAALSWSAMAAVQRLPFFPLRHVVVQGNLKQVTRIQLEDASRSALTGNFFTVDLGSAEATFEKLPWVRRAELRRHWPDGVDLTLEEQVAVARWQEPDGESRLVNDHGEVFSAATDQALPTLSGPEGSAPTVLDRFRQFGQALAAIGRQPAALMLSAREAWQLRLDDGVVVELGRDEPKDALTDRMTRFVTYYQAALQKVPMVVGVVDMRYPNGFTLRPAQKS
jgi:cell division protein FtsQ